MPISYLPFEQRKCGWVPRGLVYSVPPFIIFNAKHTGAGFPLTGNSGLKYRHVPHIFSGFDCPGQLLFPIVTPPSLLFIARRLSRGFLFGISTRCISTLEPGNILPKNSITSRTACPPLRRRTPPASYAPGKSPEPGNCRNPHSAQPRPAYRLL